MDNQEIITRFSLFSGVSNDCLAEIARYAVVLNFDSGHVIFQEGDEASNIYGVLNGEVELVLVTKDEVLETDVEYEEYTRTRTETIQRDIVVDSVGANEIFGWSALTPSKVFTSKAVCTEPTRVFSLPAEQLRGIFRKYPEAGYPFMERMVAVVSNRLANRTDKLIEGWNQAFNVDRI